jgi:hypothetical protein
MALVQRSYTYIDRNEIAYTVDGLLGDFLPKSDRTHTSASNEIEGLINQRVWERNKLSPRKVSLLLLREQLTMRLTVTKQEMIQILHFE